MIAIDQDKAGHEGYRVAKDGDNEVWAKPLAGGDWAVGLFNRGESTGQGQGQLERPETKSGNTRSATSGCIKIATPPMAVFQPKFRPTA